MASSYGHGRRQPEGAERECETGSQYASRPGADILWPLEPATAAKHRLYKRYLDAWWPILLQQRSRDRWMWPRVTYLDAFAGPGRYLGGEEGSPVFALQKLLRHDAAERMHLSRDRVRLLFMEKRSDRFQYLQSELERCFGVLDELPVWPEAYHGEAGTDAELLLEKTGAWGHPILAIFDSWGNVNVPLRLIGRLARNPASEVIVTFGPNWFSRRENLDPDRLDMVFGGRKYWERANREQRTDERWREWLTTYREALRRAGFRFQLHFQIVPKTGLPLYLVYGTKHEKGVEVMKDAMWEVDGNDGMGFADPRTRGAPLPGQEMLWGGPKNPELLELIRQRLEDGPVSLADLGHWLLVETARWRAKDAKPAVQDLLDMGAASVHTVGKLTKESVIKLR
jgi:three-Cys-motif partner protein